MIPAEPPRKWFDNPELAGPTPLTVTREGRVYGHAWLWDACHTGVSGACVAAPRSSSGYRYFHLGCVQTKEGNQIDTGRLTLGTGHAPLSMNADRTRAHYDDTGACVADIRVGEDSFGGWVAGAVRPGVSAERLRELRGSPVSGDWRQIDGRGGLELVALLAVNVPGYPVPRASARVAAALPQEESRLALVAAGVVDPNEAAERRIRLLGARAEGIDALAALAES